MLIFFNFTEFYSGRSDLSFTVRVSRLRPRRMDMIVVATKDDAALLLEIYNDSNKVFGAPEQDILDEFTKILETHFVYLLQENGETIGFIAIEEKPDHFLISALYIKKDLQHKGFGKMLLDFIENLVNEKKGKVILLKSIQMFDMVTNFYIKCGYKIITTADEISEAKTYLPVEPWEYLFGKVFS